MKRIEKEIVRRETKEYYEAYDGELFNTREECERYEDNAMGVVGKKVNKFLIKRTYSENIYGDFAAACDEKVEIYLPKTSDDIEALNQYLNFTYKDVNVLGPEHIGQYLLVNYNYDCDWCMVQTLEEKINRFKKLFYGMVEPKEENAN